MYIKTNSNNHKPLFSTSILIVACIVLTACDKLPNIFERKTDASDTYQKVQVPQTPPLEVGSSVTDNFISSDQAIANRNNSSSNNNDIYLESTEKATKKNIEPNTEQPQEKQSASSLTASIVLGNITPGTPAATVKKALDALYYDSAKKAASYYHVKHKGFDTHLEKMQPMFQKKTESVKIIDTQYSADKSTAIVQVLFNVKGESNSEPLPYQLKKKQGEWIIWVD